MRGAAVTLDGEELFPKIFAFTLRRFNLEQLVCMSLAAWISSVLRRFMAPKALSNFPFSIYPNYKSAGAVYVQL